MAALSSTSASVCARVGELACQKNPFLRELTARVASCDPVVLGTKSKKPNVDAQTMYDVVLSDSVLFPEGGGQPCDYGELTRLSDADAPAIPIRNVQRRGDTCVLSVPCALSAGESVHLRVDWARRLDHMQHHTAQHLLTAVVERPSLCGLPTVSWSLTHPYCFIVLPTGSQLEPAVMARIEEACNEAIAQAVSVRCDMYQSKEAYESEQRARQDEKNANALSDGSAEAGETRSRGIPSDVTGPIRIITVEDGIDSCTCCGTHVTSLAQLHMIKLLHQENKGDTLKLYFVTGERALRDFGAMYQRERELMRELGGVRPENFISSVVRRSRETVEMEKSLKALTLELARLEGGRLVEAARSGSGSGAVLCCRRDDVDGDFFSTLRECLSQGCPEAAAVFAWATGAAVRGEGRPGQFMIIGPAAAIAQLTPVVTDALEGKGGLSKFGYRGKGNLAAWGKLVEKLSAIKLE